MAQGDCFICRRGVLENINCIHIMFDQYFCPSCVGEFVDGQQNKLLTREGWIKEFAKHVHSKRKYLADDYLLKDLVYVDIFETMMRVYNRQTMMSAMTFSILLDGMDPK